MLLNILLLILGFILIIKGADWLIDGAESLARKLKISDIVVGLTVVAFGTSAPELAVNIMAGINKQNDMVLGNIIGSNILNILLILGVSAFIFPLNVTKNTIKKEIPFTLLACFILLIFANYDFNNISSPKKQLTALEGAILLIAFIYFLFYTYKISKNDFIEKLSKENNQSTIKMSLYIIIGLIALFFGGKFVVEYAVIIATDLGVSERFIALTIVSAGTSLPELVTSSVAALKKNPQMAVGNVVGSNLFNLLLVLGASTIISPIDFKNSFNFDIIFMTAITILLLIMIKTGKVKNNLNRKESILLLTLYIIYMIQLFYKN